MADDADSCDEFDCDGCGRHVFSLPPRDPPPTRCATCAWIAEFITDPIEAEKLRQRL